MIIFKIINEDGTLIYTLHEESHGNWSNLGSGVITFISAMKEQYRYHPLETTLTVMNDRGEYYNQEKNKYLPYDEKQSVIKLSTGRSKANGRSLCSG